MDLPKKMLFNPGPVMSSERVKKALHQPDLCHRRPDFEKVVAEVREQLLELYEVDDSYASVVLTGSGNASNEAVLSSVVREGEQLLVLVNGEFGRRLKEMAGIYNLDTRTIEYKWGEPIDPGDVEQVLSKHPGIGLIAAVYHETSTAMINPVEEIGALAEQYDCSFYADGVSAIGGENVSLQRQNIDFCTGVANKSIGGLTGVSFVCFKRAETRRRASVPRRNEYLDLWAHLELADERSQTPHTPATTMFIALREVLEEYLEEGKQRRIKRYQTCSSIIREGVRELGLDVLVPDHRASNTLTSVFLPDELELDRFIDELDRRGYVVYPGKGPLYDRKMFQVANMGRILPEHCREFLDVLESTLEDLRTEF